LTVEEVKDLIERVSSPHSTGIVHQIVPAESRLDIAVVWRHISPPLIPLFGERKTNGRDIFYLVWKQSSGGVLYEELLAACCAKTPCSNEIFFSVEDGVLVIEILLFLPHLGFQKQVLRAPLKRLGLEN
ncbi:hypothetical protein HYW30_01640, partial [Candidatus Azambacteria bacterium]|nr:hypothetical protein [Candidatus Azambacteria bacterium]